VQETAFDAVIVGSGVAGGAAAQQLCEAGLRVLVLEAGAPVSDVSCTTPSITALSEQQIQARCYAFGENTHGYFVNDVHDPYSTGSGAPFSWIRAQAVGGKSLLWAGHCYRMGNLEFKAAEEDGVGEAWPLTEQEIASYYDRAERILQVQDTQVQDTQVQDAPETLSAVADAGPEFTAAAAMHLQTAFARQGCKLVPARVSHSHTELRTRSACIHCGGTTEECLRPVSSSDSTLAAAMRTGLLTLWTQATVQNVLTNASGRATGVAGIRRSTGERFEATGRIIFLCASALESTRILLNSASPAFPHGLGNSSGVLGHYLMDHVSGIVLTATYESDKEGGKILQRENSRAGMFYVPRWQNLGKQRDQTFLRGYGYQGFIMRADHELLPCGRTKRASGRNAETSGGTGKTLLVRLAGFGEMLPYYDNFIEIDKEGRRDAAGIPVLRIHCRHRENEIAMARNMASSGLELLHAAGANVQQVQSIPSEPGLAIHESGTCRMGSNPRTSVLNRFNQCHDVPNVFVTDASSFPSIGVQNPVLTIMAMTLRACEYAVRQFFEK